VGTSTRDTPAVRIDAAAIGFRSFQPQGPGRVGGLTLKQPKQPEPHPRSAVAAQQPYRRRCGPVRLAAPVGPAGQAGTWIMLGR
jgi:hypothetical protein